MHHLYDKPSKTLKISFSLKVQQYILQNMGEPSKAGSTGFIKIHCRTHNLRVCLYIGHTACGSAPPYTKSLYPFLTALAPPAAVTIVYIKVRYDAKTLQLATFGTRAICELHIIYREQANPAKPDLPFFRYYLPYLIQVNLAKPDLPLIPVSTYIHYSIQVNLAKPDLPWHNPATPD